MHELSVTESILDIVKRHATLANAKRVKDIYLVIGQLSSIVDESVNFYWDIIAQDTLAEGASLHFRKIQAEFMCLECNRSFPLQSDEFACPYCGSVKLKIVTGREFFVESIDIEN
jgi:hydrogenase nickel incorporation protein HypA/HybF